MQATKCRYSLRTGTLPRFSSQEVAYNNDIFFLAYLKNGKPLDEDEGPVKARWTGVALQEAQRQASCPDPAWVELPEVAKGREGAN